MGIENFWSFWAFWNRHPEMPAHYGWIYHKKSQESPLNPQENTRIIFTRNHINSQYCKNVLLTDTESPRSPRKKTTRKYLALFNRFSNGRKTCGFLCFLVFFDLARDIWPLWNHRKPQVFTRKYNDDIHSNSR